MIELYDGGVYLLNGTELVADNGEAAAAIEAKTGKKVDKKEAAKETIAYGILADHNTSGNMEKLKIKFDKLTSHDITFVGIIQTARASGLTKFPDTLCIDELPQLSVCSRRNHQRRRSYVRTYLCQEIWRYVCTTSSGSYSPVRQRNAGRRRQNDSWL